MQNGPTIPTVAALALLLGACAGERVPDPPAEPSTGERAAGGRERVALAWERDARRMSAAEMDRARMDMSWQDVVQLDAPGEDGPPNAERWEEISPETVNGGPQHLPLHGDVSGPSVLRVQILLDRAHFSPGVLDGRWGRNTAEAVYWFQRREGLRATARVDSATFAALRRAAGDPERLVVEHTVTEADVAGPFTPIPDDIYAHARLECSCYESLSEALGERFHATSELLEQLNPGAALDALRPGATLRVPAVRAPDAPGEPVARIIVSGRGTYLHALDEEGRILYHFPTTLGGRYSPSPTGEFRVTSVARDPDWHYQPALLQGVDDDDADAIVPAGPNVPVGTVWMALNEPHYGIHGTNEPSTIGYASSNGCIRLTNWDAEFLARFVRPGTPVRFRDVEGRGEPQGPVQRGDAEPPR